MDWLTDGLMDGGWKVINAWLSARLIVLRTRYELMMTVEITASSGHWLPLLVQASPSRL